MTIELWYFEIRRWTRWDVFFCDQEANSLEANLKRYRNHNSCPSTSISIVIYFFYLASTKREDGGFGHTPWGHQTSFLGARNPSSHRRAFPYTIGVPYAWGLLVGPTWSLPTLLTSHAWRWDMGSNVLLPVIKEKLICIEPNETPARWGTIIRRLF